MSLIRFRVWKRPDPVFYSRIRIRFILTVGSWSGFSRGSDPISGLFGVWSGSIFWKRLDPVDLHGRIRIRLILTVSDFLGFGSESGSILSLIRIHILKEVQIRVKSFLSDPLNYCRSPTPDGGIMSTYGDESTNLFSLYCSNIVRFLREAVSIVHFLKFSLIRRWLTQSILPSYAKKAFTVTVLPEI